MSPISLDTLFQPFGGCLVQTIYGPVSVRVRRGRVSDIDPIPAHLADAIDSNGASGDLAGMVAAELADPDAAPPTPLLREGTDFQWLVWDELRRTRPGDRLTYSELATRCGRPNAVRAVGAACAANRHALLIPCHRIVRKDGQLGEYRWGADLKAVLLASEAAAAGK